MLVCHLLMQAAAQGGHPAAAAIAAEHQQVLRQMQHALQGPIGNIRLGYMRSFLVTLKESAATAGDADAAERMQQLSDSLRPDTR